MKRPMPWNRTDRGLLDLLLFLGAVFAVLCALAALIGFVSEIAQRLIDCGVTGPHLPPGKP